MEHAATIEVLVVHDDPVVAAGVCSALCRCPDFRVVQHRDSDPAVSASSSSWDVVVADFGNGVRLAAGATDEAGRVRGGVKVLIFASSSREAEIRSALAHGVRGYLLSGCGPDELIEGVRTVHGGMRCLSPEVAIRLADSLAMDPLTSREQEVLLHLADGHCNKTIARRLDIAVGTVKSHLKSVFGKLGVERRTQAVLVAQQRGLLGP